MRFCTNKILYNSLNPKNSGIIPDATAVGEAGDLDKGVVIKFYIKINDNNQICSITFQTFGCVTSIASASMVTQIIEGRSVEDAMTLKPIDISNSLDGVPLEKMYCCDLAAEAFMDCLKKAASLR